MNAHLRRELLDFAMIAGGAIPGALLRWQLDLVAHPTGGLLQAMAEANLPANLIGCLLLGLLLGQPSRHARLYLWAGIGFCGSLTTFSGWMLALAKGLGGGEPLKALVQLAIGLFGGLAFLRLGYVVGSAGRRRRDGSRE